MKRELKLFIASTLIAALTGGVPIYWQRKENRDLQLLITQPSANATRVLRQAIAHCTEVRVQRDAGENDPPDFDRIPSTRHLELYSTYSAGDHLQPHWSSLPYSIGGVWPFLSSAFA